ncbi:hypothetical protein KKC67_00310 [Patescibacteria group bacterium]|nr:hypothetical protein [Patescibacteria group bacterium]MBU0879237.1 hypothetical protein [Patescibacteria group bacterium]MBU0879965.1 hypothetical protein [Patescibacteria group bacterium]MBU1783451.1 hypothetical protein [Patescibacteria group bacterium]MBU1991439.1 hypothetical protein [Patescibacteria group bacterium]
MIGSNKQIKQKGTTFLEIIVAVGIFSVTILLATSIFQSVSDGQRSAMVAQNIQEDVRYAMEIMSREIRMAQVFDETKCFEEDQLTENRIYNTESNAQNQNQNQNGLYFKNEEGDCVKYFIKDNNLVKIKEGLTDLIPLISNKIISTKIIISNLKFDIIDSPANNIQPRVTITLDVEYSGKKMHKQQMKIQTTVSSRHY